MKTKWYFITGKYLNIQMIYQQKTQSKEMLIVHVLSKQSAVKASFKVTPKILSIDFKVTC